ncbi:MAG: hypothetical protein KC619_29570 [Myxococcales bacterium]|nr:hypothetical protein [Myxococcales bacterium]
MNHFTRRSRLRVALIQVTSALSLVAIVACGGNGGDQASPEPSLASSQPSAAASSDLAIRALSLHMDAPAGARVSELLGAQMVQADGLVVSVEQADDMDPATIEAARSQADLFSPTNLHDETLADGWILTYQNEGGLGASYFVTARRDIGGTAYMCTTTVSSAEQQQAAVAACRSLRR